MQKIEIPISRIKLILILIGSILFVILGIYLAKNPEDFMSFRHRNPEIIRIVGVFSACFFGLIGFYVIIKLFDSKAKASKCIIKPKKRTKSDIIGHYRTNPDSLVFFNIN